MTFVFCCAGKLLDEQQFPLKIPANQEAVVGPDDKPVCYKNKAPVFVPPGKLGKNLIKPS